MYIPLFNRGDRIRHSPSARYAPKHDFKIPAPKGEAPHNKAARLRQVGVSRTGEGISRIVKTQRKKRLDAGVEKRLDGGAAKII
jgi:hypothetical protein